MPNTFFSEANQNVINQEITYGSAHSGNTLKVFFGHSDGPKLKVPMLQAGVNANSKIKPDSLSENELRDIVVDYISSSCQGRNIDKIIFVADVNLGTSSGKPHGLFLNGSIEKNLADKFSPNESPKVFQVLYSSSKDIVETAAKAVTAENTVVISAGPEVKKQVNLAMEADLPGPRLTK